MTAPEDRPDSPDVLDPNGNARLLGLSPRVIGAPARLADIYDKSGTFSVAWTVRGLAARLAAAEARVEAVKALCDIPDWPPQGVDINGRAMPKHVSTDAILAALSVAPQPQPAPCSTCGQPMDTPGCSKNADDPRPRALAGFHTIAGPGPVSEPEAS